MRTLIQLLAVLIIIIVYSPIIASSDKITPLLFGMPYILWTSIVAAIALLLVLAMAYRTELKEQIAEETDND